MADAPKHPPTIEDLLPFMRHTVRTAGAKLTGGHAVEEPHRYAADDVEAMHAALGKPLPPATRDALECFLTYTIERLQLRDRPRPSVRQYERLAEKTEKLAGEHERLFGGAVESTWREMVAAMRRTAQREREIAEAIKAGGRNPPKTAVREWVVALGCVFALVTGRRPGITKDAYGIDGSPSAGPFFEFVQAATPDVVSQRSTLAGHAAAAVKILRERTRPETA